MNHPSRIAIIRWLIIGGLIIVMTSIVVGIIFSDRNTVSIKSHSILPPDVKKVVIDTDGVLSSIDMSLVYFPVGSIIMFNGSVAPENWAICNGTNGTPDLRGKVPIGLNSLVSRTYANTLGEIGGKATLDASDLPAHTHKFSKTSSGQFGADDPGILPDQARSASRPANGIIVTETNSQTVPDGKSIIADNKNLPPYLVLNFIMKKN